MNRIELFFSVLSFILITGCGSARKNYDDADRYFRDGRYDEAATRLQEGLKKEGDGRDQLLFLLDIGLVLHSANRFEESNKYFLEADKVAEIKDYSNLATDAATFIVTDEIKQYKGEDFENVMISTYLAMNYALLGKYEDSLVEIRRVDRKLYRMINEGKRNYKQNTFARYLSGIMYEMEGEYGDAYIDYKKTYELMPTLPGLGRDLWRMAKLLRMKDERERWEEELDLTEDDTKEAMRVGPASNEGEIIVLFENGISPVKRPNPSFTLVPRFFPRPNPVSVADVEVDGKVMARTAVLHDIESTAIANLDEKYAGLVAKKVAGIVAKEVIANQIEEKTNSPLLGLLARIGLYVSDGADLRSWSLLPKDLQIARFPVKAGKHKIILNPIGAGPIPEKTVEVKAGEKTLVQFRYMPF